MVMVLPEAEMRSVDKTPGWVGDESRHCACVAIFGNMYRFPIL